MDRRKFICSSALIFISGKFLLSFPFTKSNIDFFNSIVEKVKRNGWLSLPINELFSKVALLFKDIPYQGGTLENGETEQCIITFEGFDCVTFFEVSLCIARILKKNNLEYKDLVNEVTYTRYRDGIIQDFTSRLHYSSDWIFDNEKKLVVKDKTKDLGGEKIFFKLNFMSENPSFYKQLQNNPKFIEKIKEVETAINSRPYYVVPKEKIVHIEKKLKNGDIVFFATNKKGLDYSHVGICIVDNEKRRLLHASSKKGNVVLDKSIQEYVMENKSVTGITVVEPLEP
ncbi:MAG: DUF1460 domain-containing protein [Ignavibacteria bacterium]|nr:DUF1460 domain-containing protein [Ignavibacteria bacterium]